jgi:hypothetical protein
MNKSFDIRMGKTRKIRSRIEDTTVCSVYVSFIRRMILAENVVYFIIYFKTAEKVFHITSHSYR